MGIAIEEELKAFLSNTERDLLIPRIFRPAANQVRAMRWARATSARRGENVPLLTAQLFLQYHDAIAMLAHQVEVCETQCIQERVPGQVCPIL